MLVGSRYLDRGRVEARETRNKFEIELDARHIVTHVPRPDSTVAAHHPGRTSVTAPLGFLQGLWPSAMSDSSVT